MTIPFENPEKARKNLDRLTSDPFSGELFAALEPRLLHWLARVPDPDQALNHFERFVREAVNKTSLYRLLLQYDHFLEILLKILSFSNYLADILIRDPGHFYWLVTTGINQTHLDTEAFAEEISTGLDFLSSPAKKLARLKRLKRREILRIGALDLLEWNTLTATVQNLSDLADSLVQAGLSLVEKELEPQFGHPPCPFAVLGLGKLGGQELNYSSDIDILFVYAEEGQGQRRDTGRTFSFHEYFNRLSEKLVHLLSEFSEGEALYRVDTRLRPEGEAGPLARSLASMLHYYEIRGRLWERQMLIKARPVAGDRRFGQQFLHQLEHFIYPGTFFRSPLEEIRHIKQTIEEKLTQRSQGDTNVKLSQGGIRDVEFTVQAFQLLNAGRNRALREPNTLRALAKLADSQLLTSDEAQTLRKAYIFFRKIEHHLQLEDWRQTHLLPEKPHRRLVLARKLGFGNWRQFRDVLRRHTVAVRNIYNSIFTNTDSQSPDARHPEEPPSPDWLRAQGFENPVRARRILMRLSSGTHEHPTHPGERDAFSALLPVLLKEIVQTPWPDETLQNLENLIRAHGARKTLFRLLKENAALRRLFLNLAGRGNLLVQYLAAEPELFGILLTPTQWQRLFSQEEFQAVRAQRAQAFPEESISRRLLYLKHFFQIRIGFQFLENFFSLPTMFRQLSELADSLVIEELASVLQELWGAPDFPAAIFALGKWGVFDLNFSSDLDVIFLTTHEKTIPEQEKVLRHFIAQMTQMTPAGQLYKIDARLRAEGRNAPLLISVDTYQRYLLTRGQLWERQALLRLRLVAGDTQANASFRSFLDEYLFASGLSQTQMHEIEHMLTKIQSKVFSRRQRGLDVKNAPGGIVQIEFLVQTLQLKYGKEHPSLRRGSTAELLRVAAKLGLLSQRDADFLEETYLLYRRLEAVLHVGLQRPRAVLPLEPSKLEFTARALRFETSENLLTDIHERMAQVRRIWQKILG